MWVGGRQVRVGDALTEARAAAFVTDAVVRDFTGWPEVTAYIDRTSDHVGTLPGPNCGGAWIRFAHDAHMNILGENHDYVDFEQVGPAVRATSFTYEPFSTDTLAAGTELRRVYLDENRQRLNLFGIAGAPNLAPYGGESLYPKIADTTADLIPYFAGTSPMAVQRPPNYDGIPNQRYLRMAWAHAHDLAAGHPATAAETAVVREYNTHLALLGGWFNGLAVDGYLGVALQGHGDFLLPLRDFCLAYSTLMVERARADNDIDPAHLNLLQGMPHATPAQMLKLFGRWRNYHFAAAVIRASAAHVRYAAMGAYHMAWLRKKNLTPAGAHEYDLCPPAGYADRAAAATAALGATAH